MKLRCVLCLLAFCLLVGCAPVPQDEVISLVLEYRGAALTVGMPEGEALAALGDDYTLSEAESCAGVGVDRMYTYPSLRLYVFAPADGEAAVTSVSYTDDGADTAGVRIGSTREAVIAAFGEPDEQGDGALVYRRGGACLTVSLRDGRVSAVVLSEE